MFVIGSSFLLPMEAKTKIFGEHDPATIKQIETCVAAGGERGVLCADGWQKGASVQLDLKTVTAKK